MFAFIVACFSGFLQQELKTLKKKGIKLALKSEITTEKCFFKLYAEFILAYQVRAREIGGNTSLKLPLAIMTSGLKDNQYIIKYFFLFKLKSQNF